MMAKPHPMARFLLAPVAATGHVNPGLPIAAEPLRRGHEVRWYTSPRFERKVKGVGAHYVPYVKGIELQEGRIDCCHCCHFCVQRQFGIIRLRIRQPNRARLLTSVNATRLITILRHIWGLTARLLLLPLLRVECP